MSILGGKIVEATGIYPNFDDLLVETQDGKLHRVFAVDGIIKSVWVGKKGKK